MAEYFGNICTCRKCNGIVHTIRRGDTLYLLSRYYNVTINEIMRANANVNIYNLQIGDQICIPVRRPAPSMPSQNPGQGRPQPPRPGMPQPDRPQRPSLIQPRENDNLDDVSDDLNELIEDLLDANDNRDNRDRMQSDNMMESKAETDSMSVNTTAMDKREAETVEASRTCCGGMRVKDVLNNEDMTLEELAKMLKNM